MYAVSHLQNCKVENNETSASYCVAESGPVSGTHKENVKLKRCVQQLEEENSLLKLKCEILLNMVRCHLPYTAVWFHYTQHGRTRPQSCWKNK